MDDILLKQSDAALGAAKMVQENSSGTRLHNRAEATGPRSTDARQQENNSPNHLRILVNQANLKAGTYNNKIKFQIENDGQPPKILILDKESGEVIRKIPSDEMENINNKMEKFIGTIFNGRV